jgi:hypothetical protein
MGDEWSEMMRWRSMGREVGRAFYGGLGPSYSGMVALCADLGGRLAGTGSGWTDRQVMRWIDHMVRLECNGGYYLRWPPRLDNQGV